MTNKLMKTTFLHLKFPKLVNSRICSSNSGDDKCNKLREIAEQKDSCKKEKKIGGNYIILVAGFVYKKIILLQQALMEV